ncbi:MAG: hypothetical protein ACT4PK_04870 [Gammaproteobacteria bacterium]
MTPQLTFTILLAVQALHLLHHRLAKRHISFAEVLSAFVLCIPLTTLPPALLVVMHLGLASVQVVGSVWIRRLSPDWSRGGGLLARLG